MCFHASFKIPKQAVQLRILGEAINCRQKATACADWCTHLLELHTDTRASLRGQVSCDLRTGKKVSAEVPICL